MLAGFFVDPNTTIPGPSKGGCTVIDFAAVILNCSVYFLALVHFLLALIMFPLHRVNLRFPLSAVHPSLPVPYEHYYLGVKLVPAFPY